MPLINRTKDVVIPRTLLQGFLQFLPLILRRMIQKKGEPLRQRIRPRGSFSSRLARIVQLEHNDRVGVSSDAKDSLWLVARTLLQPSCRQSELPERKFDSASP